MCVRVPGALLARFTVPGLVHSCVRVVSVSWFVCKIDLERVMFIHLSSFQGKIISYIILKCLFVVVVF